MAYNEFLADRIEYLLNDMNIAFVAKKMMGGICYLVDDKMCVGIVKEELMVRLDPEIYHEAISKTGCRPMDFTKRPIKGFVFVDQMATDMDIDLKYWIQLALDYNPKAKSSKNK